MTPRIRLDAAHVKAEACPVNFYRGELPNMPGPRLSRGLVNGGLCPFHPDTRPNSFFVNLSTGGYVCFSCGAKGGDMLAFLMARDGSTFREALEYISENYT
jgi:hypothetical protein